MAQLTINVGAVPNDNTGDALRDGFIKVNSNFTELYAAGGDALVANPLSQFAATTSLQLAGVLSDETGAGSLVFNTSPTLVTPLLGTPTSGNLLSCTVNGTDKIGYLDVPTNAKSVAYTLLLSDAGKAVDHPATDAVARTFTIPANATVAYPIGTTVTFTNMAPQPVTIAITTDTMYLAGVGTTGNRTLAQFGMATARKLTATTWVIAGTGLT